MNSLNNFFKELEAITVLDQLNKCSIDYNEFADLTLNQVLYHIFVKNIHEYDHFPPPLSNDVCDISRLDGNPLVRHVSVQHFKTVFEQSILDANIDPKKAFIFINQMDIISALFKCSLLENPISEIKELAKEDPSISKKQHDLVVTHLGLLKTSLNSYGAGAKGVGKAMHSVKKIMANIEKDALGHVYDLAMTNHKVHPNKQKMILNELKSTAKNQLGTIPEYKGFKQLVNCVIIVSGEFWDFHQKYGSDLEQLIKDGSITSRSITPLRLMIEDLAKGNKHIQKNMLPKDIVMIEQYKGAFKPIQEQIKSVCDLHNLCTELLQTEISKLKIHEEKNRPILDFPELDFVKRDRQKRKFRAKKTKKKQLPVKVDLVPIEKSEPKTIEKIPEKTVLFKEIKIEAVEKNLLNMIKENKIDQTLIQEFDYLFKSQGVTDANAASHIKMCSFILFINELLNNNLSSLGVIIPELFLNLAVQIEQESKCFMKITEEDEITHTHSLKKIVEKDEKLSEKFNTFLNDFNYAIIWMRYPEHARKMYEKSKTIPQALKWAVDSIGLMQEIQKNKVLLDKNRIKTILQLVDFVFDSMTQSYSLLAFDRKELTNLLKPWKEYLGVIRKKIELSLHSKLNKKLEMNEWEKDDPIRELETLINKAPNLDLQEAIQHLQRTRVSVQLMQSNGDPIFTPWFARNLISPWAVEALLRWMINQNGHQGTISTHDFEAMLDYLDQLTGEEMIFKSKERILELNIGITHHYPVSRQTGHRGNSFKDYYDMILTASQYIEVIEKEKERNRIDNGRLKSAQKNCKEVIAELIAKCVEIQKAPQKLL